MSFGHFLDPETQAFTDDHLIGKAMEALRIRFPSLPQAFYGDNWNRARLILKVEGRSTQAVVNALIPFAKAQSKTPRNYIGNLRDVRATCDRLLKERGIA